MNVVWFIIFIKLIKVNVDEIDELAWGDDEVTLYILMPKPA